MQETKFITIDELMKRYRISRTKIHSLVKNGKFPSGIKIGAVRRWPIEQIEAFEAAGLKNSCLC